MGIHQEDITSASQGFWKTKRINFEETFAPTPNSSALRLLLLISTSHKWVIKTLDIKLAFLLSMIDMPVFIWPPQGMNIEQGKLLRFKKALYGTKHAAHCWWQNLTRILEDIGFHPNKEDLSTYTYTSDVGTALLWIHVDDGVLTSSSDSLSKTILQKMSLVLNIKWDRRVSGSVGLTIEAKATGLCISQSNLIEKLTSLSSINIMAK
ncbi:hypothetical protein O181_121013 [Austropuccinia psidii MF-1]|uniref:Reverse transcriptase Ty1/copia-type domain-containing protein n=1 Tax=Austropuccinia psidii MF-1 TaxID=1389203 RepID=A0A9Q3Q0W3_9BASI|nr:hypothetical protein [Austropuccinia psidii MF-1]